MNLSRCECGMNRLEDIRDFDSARIRAFVEMVLAWLRGRRDRVRSLAEVLKTLRASAETYVGLQTIQVVRIVGSESRAGDFSGSFLPLRAFQVHRWSRINGAFREGIALPAIRVFELDGRYYVRDGNHRVSVARFHGLEYIDAEIVKIAAA